MPTALKEKFKGAVKSLDFLAPDIGLNYEGRSGVKTYLGALLSILATAAFLTGTGFILRDAFRRDKPSVLVEVANSREYPVFDLVANKWIPVVLFVPEGGPLPPKQAARYMHVRATLNNEKTSPTGEYNNQETPIEMVPCSQLGWDRVLEYSPKEATAYEKYVLMNFGLCPDIRSAIKVFGRFGDPEQQILSIGIFPCVPELLVPGDTCAPKASLQESRVFFAQAVINVDLTNHEQPVSYSWDTESDYGLLLDSISRISAKLKSVEVWNSYGSFVSDSLVAKFATLETQRQVQLLRDSAVTECTLQKVTASTCQPYIRFDVLSGGIQETHTRNYSGILQILGDIGGIREVISSFFIFFYLFFHTRAERKQFSEKIFADCPMDKRGSKMLESQKGKDIEGSTRTKHPLDQNKVEAMELLEPLLDITNLVKALCFVHLLQDFLMQTASEEEGNHDLAKKIPAALCQQLQTSSKSEPKSNLQKVSPSDSSLNLLRDPNKSGGSVEPIVMGIQNNPTSALRKDFKAFIHKNLKCQEGVDESHNSGNKRVIKQQIFEWGGQDYGPELYKLKSPEGVAVFPVADPSNLVPQEDHSQPNHQHPPYRPQPAGTSGGLAELTL